MPTTLGNSTSMFYLKEIDQSIFNFAAYTENCQKKYGLTPNYDWAL
jgi:hypothetical protein